MALSKIDGTNLIAPTIPVASGGTGSATLAGAGLANTPAFEVNPNGQTINISNDVDTVVVFTNEIYDSNSAYDTSNGKFTPQTAGKYFIYARITYNKTGDFESIRCDIKKNGTLIASAIDRNFYFTSVGVYTTQIFNGSTDYIQLLTQQQSGGTAGLDVSNSGARCVFGAYRITGA